MQEASEQQKEACERPKIAAWISDRLSVTSAWAFIGLIICVALSFAFYAMTNKDNANQVAAAGTLASSVFAFFTMMAVLYTITYEIPKTRNNKIFDARCACAAKILEAIEQIERIVGFIRSPLSFLHPDPHHFEKYVIKFTPKGMEDYLKYFKSTGESFTFIKRVHYESALFFHDTQIYRDFNKMIAELEDARDKAANFSVNAQAYFNVNRQVFDQVWLALFCFDYVDEMPLPQAEKKFRDNFLVKHYREKIQKDLVDLINS